MPLRVEWSQQSALMRRIEAVRAAAQPGGRANARALGAIRTAVIEDHHEKLERGVTRYGTPRAPLAAATLANPRRGPGPSLIPRGRASRFYANFRAEWRPGTAGTNVLAMGYVDFNTKSGLSIPSIHETGTARIPARPTAGITPQGWKRIDAILHQYGIDVLKGA